MWLNAEVCHNAMRCDAVEPVLTGVICMVPAVRCHGVLVGLTMVW